MARVHHEIGKKGRESDELLKLSFASVGICCPFPILSLGGALIANESSQTLPSPTGTEIHGNLFEKIILAVRSNSPLVAA